MAAKSVSGVVGKYLEQQGVTLRLFGDALGVTHATVINWRDGASQPSIEWLMLAMKQHCDWRREFALECLEARFGSDAFRALHLRELLSRDC